MITPRNGITALTLIISAKDATNIKNKPKKIAFSSSSQMTPWPKNI